MAIVNRISPIFYPLPAGHILLLDALFFCAVVVVAKGCRRITAIYILFVLPGTCAHELAHFFAAICTNGRPRLPSLIPARTRDGWLLGSVQLGNARWYNAAVIALAPLWLLPISIWLYVHRIAAISLPNVNHWVYLYTVIVVSMSALPSRIDLRLAWKYSAGLLVSVGLSVLSYVLLKQAAWL